MLLRTSYEIGDHVLFVNRYSEFYGEQATVIGLKILNGKPFCTVTITGLEKIDVPADDEHLENISVYFRPVVDAPADTKLPKRGTMYSAGYDFYAPERIVIPAHGCTGLIFFNVKARFPGFMYLKLFIRSSIAVKHSIMLETSGVIDSDYYENPDNDGNIGVKFRNNSDVDFVIEKGERCFQGIFHRYFITIDDESENVRVGGYGSTGKK